MRRLRVLHVVPALFGSAGQLGGAERYAAELARAMADRADVRILSYGDRADHLDINGVPAEILAASPIRENPFNRFSPLALTRARWADVVHCHQQHVISSSALAAFGRLTRRPIVVTDHGGGGFDVSRYVSTDRWFKAHLHVSAFSLRQRWSPAALRASVVYAGVDSKRFCPSAWTADRRRILFVGRVHPHKGVHNLIDALPDGTELDIIGPLDHPRYAADLRCRAVGKSVRIHGSVNEEALVTAYSRALCIVLPSVCDDLYGGHTEVPELLGQTLLEGMASGLPAICTDAGGMPEIVVDTETGFVIAQNDVAGLRARVGQLAGDQDRARALGAAGRRRVLEKFTWPLVVDRCLSVYEELRRR